MLYDNKGVIFLDIPVVFTSFNIIIMVQGDVILCYIYICYIKNRIASFRNRIQLINILNKFILNLLNNTYKLCGYIYIQKNRKKCEYK